MPHEEYIRSELEEKIAAMRRTVESIEDRISFCEDQLVTNLTLSHDAKIAYRTELIGLESELKSKQAQLNELLMQTARTKQ